MDLTTALYTAVAALTTGIVALFWIYVKQRDADEKRYEKFNEIMIPLLTELNIVAKEMTSLVGVLTRRRDSHE